MAASDQFRAFWHQLGVNQRVTIVMFFLFVLSAMIGLLIWSSQPKMARLGKFDERDLGEIVELVKGQEVEHRIEGTSIFVPSDAVEGLKAEIATQGLVTGGSVGFEIFDGGSFGVSDFVQKTNKARAIQGELERTIEAIQGVRNARVQVVMRETKLLLQSDHDRAKGSVFVDTGGYQLTNEQVLGIQNLVSFAVKDMIPSDVSVIDNRGINLSSKVNQDGEFATANSQVKFRKAVEEYFNNKVTSLLLPVVGPGNVVPQVSVDVDTDTSLTERETFDPESQVARMEDVQKEESKTTEILHDPIVGEQTNTPLGLSGAVGGRPLTSDNETSLDRKQISYEISRIRETTNTPAGKILGKTASVFVNQRPDIAPNTELQGADAKPIPNKRTEEEINEIRVMVATALGIVLTPEELELPTAGRIVVTELPFIKQPLPQPSLLDQVKEWFEFLKNPLLVGIALVLFFLFLNMLKKHKPAITPMDVLEAKAGVEDALAKADVTPRPTPELLNELIQEKPENVAQALKSWSAIK